MVLYSHSKEQDRSKAGKEKTMKTFYFDNFDDFEESGVAGEYEVTAIVKKRPLQQPLRRPYDRV